MFFFSICYALKTLIAKGRYNQSLFFSLKESIILKIEVNFILERYL